MCGIGGAPVADCLAGEWEAHNHETMAHHDHLIQLDALWAQVAGIKSSKCVHMLPVHGCSCAAKMLWAYLRALSH
jgi:hypothetical protein